MTSTTGISRRDVMKKGAVAGAIVWSAPILTSSPAFAATGKCSGSKPCERFFYAKVENSSCKSGETGDGNNCPSFTVGDLKCPGTNPPAIAEGCSYVTGSSHDGDGGSFIYAANVIPLIIQLKPGGGSDVCYTYQFDAETKTFSSSNPAPANCLTSLSASGSVSGGITISFTWNNGSVCKGMSHMGTYFCV